ncbi:MAG TPA: c-type cytochrome [Blastocatellia bacterium]|nr:c-type cytochrome [Blastocatellia bacterium]
MKRSVKRFIALIGIMFALRLSGIAILQPAVAMQSSQADARAVVQKICGTACHALERATVSPRSRAQWEDVISKMISMGAKGTDEEFATALNYLATNYGRDASAAQANRPAGKPVGVLGAGANDKHIVDNAAADRGRSVWAAQCINCHGTTARGTDKGANLVRSDMMWSDRYGSDLGPFLQKGHPTQSGAPSADLSKTQVEELSHFIHQRLYDTLRGSPIFNPQNVLTGNVKEGEAYFNGEGKCNTCHSVTDDLAGYGKTANPVNIQQRFMFPRARRQKLTITVTLANGAAVTGTPIHIDDFDVSLRDDKGEYHSWKRSAALKVVKNDPLKAHIELLDKITDKNMHDIVAYLESLK